MLQEIHLPSLFYLTLTTWVVLSHLGGIISPECNRMAKEMLEWCIQYGFVIIAGPYSRCKQHY